jgi:hypothetical protein
MDGLDGCGLDKFFNDDRNDNKLPWKLLELTKTPKHDKSIADLVTEATLYLERPDRKPWEAVS